MMEKILEVKDLNVSFNTYAGEVQAVRGVSFDLKQKECLAIVGESGSGKSVTAKAIIKLIHDPGVIKKGSSIKYLGEELANKNFDQMRKIRGSEISMIFQDALTSLNPTKKVGHQVAQSLIIHQKMGKREAFDKAVEMLRFVKIPNPERRANQYPHEFSGGMRQRAMIAMALVNKPNILIADEPTTALDVTIQAQIIDLLKDMQEELNTAIVMITHDLGVVAGSADRIAVMYGGMIVEQGPKKEIFYRPKHPYTWALLNSVPRLNTKSKETLYSIKGTPPDLIQPPLGCPFAPRCEFRLNICNEKMPTAYPIIEGHDAKCWLLDERAPKVKVFERLEV